MHFLGRVTRAWRRKGGDEKATLQGLELVRAGRCYLCGGLVEDGLARAGSPMCHDCRAGCVHEPVRTHA
jgi:hypothetical protein